MKGMVGMVCVTAVAIAHLVINGDGAALVAAISAISGLAGVQVGYAVAEASRQKD